MNTFNSIKKTLGKWFSIPWYPLVFALYPALALLAENIGQVKLQAGLRPLVVSVGLGVILFGLFRLLLRNWNGAAFLAMLLMVLFFSYGHVYILLTNQLKDVNFTNWLLIGWGVLAVIAVIWAVKKPPSPEGLNLIVLGLVLASSWQIGSGLPPGGVHRLSAENAPVENLTLPQNPPDVYYFILDMYTRQDLLQSSFNYDNSGFIKDLESRGFYVAQCSQSNYTRTELSVASSLNMSYLPALDPAFDDPKSIKRLHLWDTLKHSTVRYELEQMGYKTVSFPTGFAWSELDDANVFLTVPSFSSGITEFETLFMQTTLARILQDFGKIDLDQIDGQNFRDRDMLVFNSMKSVANMPGPKFVYVHLIMPHPPFVWGPNGEHTNPADFWNAQKLYPADKFKIGYINQITFLNKKMLDVVDTIISESKNPPIIILQGDHGPWLQPNPQHFFIFNAYYLPNHIDGLYPRISPVNSFRYVFNSYFGGKYDMLPDITYFSPVPNLYSFSKVNNPCK